MEEATTGRYDELGRVGALAEEHKGVLDVEFIQHAIDELPIDEVAEFLLAVTNPENEHYLPLSDSIGILTMASRVIHQKSLNLVGQTGEADRAAALAQATNPLDGRLHSLNKINSD